MTTSSTYKSVATPSSPRELFQVNGHHNLTVIDVGFGCELQARSPFSGTFNTIYSSMSFETMTTKLTEWLKHRALIQNVFPTLNADEREFLLTGVTKEEWNTYMVDADEEAGDQIEVGE